jgi:beta-galactosidase
MKLWLRIGAFFCAIVALGGMVSLWISTKGSHEGSLLVIDARATTEPPPELPFAVGGRSPDGHTLGANSRFLTLDGTPWFPVMGEFHFSRYPESEWEQELLKMKAGGVQIVSTYLFWIHHEEIKGQFDWAGRRDLRQFVELCAKHGLYVWLRVGPWAHGECRNGGFPDWLLQECPTRENNPVYLENVRRYFEEISRQVRGQFWEEGGPIIGVQIENEYSTQGPGKGDEHMTTLLKLARDSGLGAPFYTATGWDDAQIPAHDFLPVFGGYPTGFWERSVTELPPGPNFFFTKIRCGENVGDDLRSKRPDIDAHFAAYPFLTAEMGGGMELSYHRRPLMSGDDIAAMTVAKLGSGITLSGYYMFHGGTNPDGKITTLQESQTTGYPNDLPVKTYDYQAPLGEFGEMHPSFRELKTLDLFLAGFGASLAPMAPYFPERQPENLEDTATPRVAARLNGDHGYIFINNYQRTYPLPERKNLQVRLETPEGAMNVPRAPVDVPSGAYVIWPVNLDVGGTTVRYATAQLLCKVQKRDTYVFFAWPGIPAEFAFKEPAAGSIEALSGQLSRDGQMIYVRGIRPGTNVAIRIERPGGAKAQIIVLSREQALNTWKAKLEGQERLVISHDDLFFDGDRVYLRAQEPSFEVGFFPRVNHTPSGFKPVEPEGVFDHYNAAVKERSVTARVETLRDADDPPPLRMGRDVAMAPTEADFEKGARWRIQIPKTELSGVSNLYLRLRYVGDIARIYAGSELVDDNFYNGTPWEIGLDRIPARRLEKGLGLTILPLRQDVPIYLPPGARPDFPQSGEVLKLEQVEVVPEYQAVMDLRK